MKTNALIKFLQENLQRLFTKSPKFFKIWMVISGAFVLITGIPEALAYFEINLPDLWSEPVNTAVAWASRAAFIMALLTTTNGETKNLRMTKEEGDGA